VVAIAMMIVPVVEEDKNELRLNPSDSVLYPHKEGVADIWRMTVFIVFNSFCLCIPYPFVDYCDCFQRLFVQQMPTF
jgi:hypothetical protein